MFPIDEQICGRQDFALSLETEGNKPVKNSLI